MSDRDELAEILERSDPEGGSHPDYGGPEFSYWYPQADAVIAAGWRKRPSREELRIAIDRYDSAASHDENLLDAILALLDGPTETGEK